MKALYYILTILSTCEASFACAQRINFKTFVEDESIGVNILENPMGLNFNRKEPLLYPGLSIPVSIGLNDVASVVVEIDAPLEYDLSLSFISENLTLEGNGVGESIPFSLQFAYNNTGETNDIARRLAAVEVPTGFSNLTLPVRRRAAGAPGPPPTPEHGGYVRPRGKVYIFVYGTLGPISSSVLAGDYMSNINLTIDYADTAF